MKTAENLLSHHKQCFSIFYKSTVTIWFVAHSMFWTYVFLLVKFLCSSVLQLYIAAFPPPRSQMLELSSSLGWNTPILVLPTHACYSRQFLLFLQEHLRLIKTAGVHGPGEIILTNKLSIFNIKKINENKDVPSSTVTGQGTSPVLSPSHHPKGWSIFPSCSQKHTNTLSCAELGSLDALCVPICSVSRWAQLPPDSMARGPEARDGWAQQPRAGAASWETAKSLWNAPFVLSSPSHTATVRLLLIMPFHPTHFYTKFQYLRWIKNREEKQEGICPFCLLDNSSYKSQLCSDSLHYFSLSFLSSSTSLLQSSFCFSLQEEESG